MDSLREYTTDLPSEVNTSYFLTLGIPVKIGGVEIEAYSTGIFIAGNSAVMLLVGATGIVYSAFRDGPNWTAAKKLM